MYNQAILRHEVIDGREWICSGTRPAARPGQASRQDPGPVPHPFRVEDVVDVFEATLSQR